MLEDIDLAPGFDPSVLSYTAATDFLDRDTNLMASPDDPAASVSIDGSVLTPTGVDLALQENSNLVEILVTAEDGSTQTYSLVIQRESGEGQRLLGTGTFSDHNALFRINEDTGETIRISGEGMGGNEVIGGLAYNPTDNVVYASENFGNYLLSIDPATGIATRIGRMGFPVDALAYDPDGEVLFGVTGSPNDLVTIDITTGVGTVVGRVDHNFVLGLAYDSNANILYGVTFDELVTIDPATAQSTLAADLGNTVFRSLTYDTQSDTLYGVDVLRDQIVRIDPANGTLTPESRVRQGLLNALAFDGSEQKMFGFDFDTAAFLVFDPQNNNGEVVGDLGFDNVRGLTVDTNTGIVYGVDTSTDELLRVNRNTGEATLIGPLGRSNVRDLAFDPNTSTLYSVDVNEDRLVRIDPNSGTLTPIGLVDSVGFEAVVGLAFDPSTDTLFGSDTVTDQLITIDVTTGVGTAVGDLGFELVRGLATDFATLYGTDAATGQLLVIDKDTGEATAVSEWDSTEVRGLAFDPETREIFASDTVSDQLIRIDPAFDRVNTLSSKDISGFAYVQSTDTLYASDPITDELYSVNPATGVATKIGPMNHGEVSALAYDANAAVMYGTDVESNTLLTVDINTGATVTIGDLNSDRVAGLAYDADNEILYGVTALPSYAGPNPDSGSLVSIDTATGQATTIGEVGYGYLEGLAYDDGTGKLYATDGIFDELVEIDPASGTGTLIDKHRPSRVSAVTENGRGGLFVAQDGGPNLLFEMNVENARSTTIGALSMRGVASLSWDGQENKLYGLEMTTPRRLVEIDVATGNSTDIVAMEHFGITLPMAFVASTQTFYSVEEVELFSINATDGSRTMIGNTGLTEDIAALAYATDTDTMYAVANDITAALYTIDLQTGLATLVGDLGVSEVSGLAFDAVNEILYANNSDNLYVINRVVGNTSLARPLQSPQQGLASMD